MEESISCVSISVYTEPLPALNKGDSSYHSENPFSGSVTTVGEWGSDEWSGNVWHPSGSGTDTGIQRCFTEMKMTFDNFSSLINYLNINILSI